MTFLILGLLSLSALALLGAIFFLYRYLMRSHLFPQLPRVWRVEKVRFFLCSTVFVVCFAAFLLTGWLNNQNEEAEESVIYQTQPSQNQPSFDGAPPASGQEQERALPPRSEDQLPPSPVAVISGGQDKPPAVPAPTKPETDKPQDSGQSAPAMPEDKPPAKPEAKPEPIKPEQVKPPVTDKPAASAESKPKPAPQPTQPTQPPIQLADNDGKPPLPQPKPYVPDPADLANASAPGSQPTLLPDQASPPAQPTQPTTQPTATEALFTVCVASYASEAGAQSELKNFASLGQARIVAADIPGKGRWYRICVNGYATQAQAQAAASGWRNSGAAKGAFVVRLP